MGEFTRKPFVDPMIRKELDNVQERVLKKDRDFVCVVDGEEGCGKSVLAMQFASLLSPGFNLEHVVFNSQDFIRLIRDPKTKKGTCIVLDEAFNAANARASLSDINRAMIALATEMRQKNLFVILVLPTFFDLDKYFALWRTRILVHVYFTPNEDRRYIVFDKQSKKLLYLSGKKTYDYSYPKAPFPPSTFYNQYTVPEDEYRERKAEAFRKRTVSGRARTWLLQRNALLKHLMRDLGYTQQHAQDTLKNAGVEALSHAQMSFITNEVLNESGGMESIEETPKTPSKV